jgi:hypothetical protein
MDKKEPEALDVVNLLYDKKRAEAIEIIDDMLYSQAAKALDDYKKVVASTFFDEPVSQQSEE